MAARRSQAAAGPLAHRRRRRVIASAARGRSCAAIRAPIVVALDAATGAVALASLAIDATELARDHGDRARRPDGVIVGGSFAGRCAPASTVVVERRAQTDGFVARIDAARRRRLARAHRRRRRRCASQGVARARRIASRSRARSRRGADMLGEPLPPVDERCPSPTRSSPSSIATGKRAWIETFGGRLDDAVAGVAIDARDRVVVAATARGDRPRRRARADRARRHRRARRRGSRRSGAAGR